MYGVAAFKCWGVEPVEPSRETLRSITNRTTGLFYLLLPTHVVATMAAAIVMMVMMVTTLLMPIMTPHASQQHYSSTRRGTELVTAMDNLNAFLMLLQGTLLEDAAKRWEKQMEEKEQIAQQASRKKVMEWMRTRIVCDDHDHPH
jgi:ABC-type transport system involved in cytochrome bd biosynthesis fused ATPase/permease subunit